jgi:TonB family protein
LVLPLIAGIFYAFATPEYKFVQTGNSSETIIQAQEGKIVKGKIVNDEGQPLKGANIVISGTTIGTISDASGNFELKVEDDTPLVFSFVGHDSKEVKPDFYWQMLVVMKIKTIEIEAVGNFDTKSEKKPSPSLILIDGKQSTKAEMDKINPDKIDKVAIYKDKMAIDKFGEKGKDGVIDITLKPAENVSTQTFKVQSNSPLKFGDANSFGKQPLIIVDGVIGMQDVNNIPPETIEFINVLKDESATKVYGDKGKNGVILITTKKGASASQNTPIDVKVTGYANNQNENTSTNTGVKIRSTGTSETGSKPLIVIDGVIAEDQNMDKIEPNTVESMNVLKGEMATKKYGEKGKNGVIEITMKGEKEYFVVVEEMPEFPGGVQALKTYVAATVKYPANALKNGIQGKVFVNFIVGKDGSVSNAKIAQGVDSSLDAEAIRVVESMPKWNPGKQRGELVEVRYTIPVEFKLPAK